MTPEAAHISLAFPNSHGVFPLQRVRWCLWLLGALSRNAKAPESQTETLVLPRSLTVLAPLLCADA